MKKNTLFTLFLTLTLGFLYGQQEKGITGYDNWLRNWTDFSPNKAEYALPTQILSGNISKDTKLYKKDIYLLYGDVFVTDSTTLEIEPGTVIMGDFKTKGSLIISKGSKIVAEGSVTDPIIFTSSQTVRKPGDWGGIFLLGDAPINSGNNLILNYGLDTSSAGNISYGGESISSNSGVLNYVRIEYAGRRTKNFGYFNALTLAGVGCDTSLNNVMISYCDGDSVSVLGGDVLLNNFVSYRSSSDDYKINYGASCKITNSLAVKSPYVSRAVGSRTLHVLNHDENTVAFTSKIKTKVEAENLTLLNQSNNLENDIKIGLVNEAIYIGDDVTFKLDKSVISGFNPAVIFDRKIIINNESLDQIVFTRNYFNNCNGNIYVKYKPNNEDLENWYGNRIFNNVYSKGPDTETFIDSKSLSNPDFRLRINRIIATNND
ncbi:hypothetical protein [Bizionia paragorgiae]|uniref:Uncharacterized protein n=1 Tax=Bizionia paragorgiae TaxID=283786 RepID=A0A1H4D6S0_BIZPA|nr:hypothetical protein [Bizionia paragorgiae]SEA68307.1 hypothetical protein SAMN04487990_12519 [Bizionia paragorgiae]